MKRIVLSLFLCALFVLAAVEGLIRAAANYGFVADPAQHGGALSTPASPERFKELVLGSSTKPRDQFRVAIVGDSFTFPGAVPDDGSFASRLRRRLSEPGTPQTQVIRFGAPQLNAPQKIVHLRKALRAQADLVLLEIDFDDPLPADQPANQLDGARRAGPEPLGPLLSRWKTAGVVAGIVERHRSGQALLRTRLQSFNDPAHWSNFADSLMVIRQLINERNTPLVAVLFPALTVQPAQDYPYQPLHHQIIDFLATQQIPTLDLLHAVQQVPLVRLTTADRRGSELLHEVAAVEIERFLKQQRLLPEPNANPASGGGLSRTI